MTGSPDAFASSKAASAAAKEPVISDYMRWLGERKQTNPSSYGELWQWSVSQPTDFWGSLWDYFGVQPSRQGRAVLTSPAMPGSRWFEGENLSYARNALGHPSDDVAFVCRNEAGARRAVTYGELRQEVARAADAMAAVGISKGDRVAAILPNVEEAVVAFLAAASLGAIWVLCSPEFGAESMIARLEQTDPKLMITADGYRFNGRVYDVRDKVRTVGHRLPSLLRTVFVRSGLVIEEPGEDIAWSDFLDSGSPREYEWEDVAFEDPLWILFSSGTTGIPKAMLHGHGGIVLEHLKSLVLHNDVKRGDVLFWYTSTAWMMWNYVVSVLLTGGTSVLFDGAPDPSTLWSLARDEGVTLFGASPGFYQLSTEGELPVEPWPTLRTLGSTGSPLSEETERRLAAAVPSARVASVSGGTDVCSGFVGPSPILPVRTGWMQCRMLGVDCVALNAAGDPVVGEIGELAVRSPMPSMPLRFWGDVDNKRYVQTYFAQFPGVWSHGDWVQFDEAGQARITGRSDATLNRGGVRMGTSEFYRVLEPIDWVRDSMVIDASDPTTSTNNLVLFLVVDGEFSEARRAEISSVLRQSISPRHVPDVIVPVPEVPYTLTGKKCEIPVKRILLGWRPEDAADAESLLNPTALMAIVGAAKELEVARKASS